MKHVKVEVRNWEVLNKVTAYVTSKAVCRNTKGRFVSVYGGLTIKEFYGEKRLEKFETYVAKLSKTPENVVRVKWHD